MEQTAAAIYITEMLFTVAEQIAFAKYRTVSLREHPENLITEQIAFAIQYLQNSVIKRTSRKSFYKTDFLPLKE